MEKTITLGKLFNFSMGVILAPITGCLVKTIYKVFTVLLFGKCLIDITYHSHQKHHSHQYHQHHHHPHLGKSLILQMNKLSFRAAFSALVLIYCNHLDMQYQ